MSTPNPTTRHMHHIVPRHMGGSDDESNLISLTVEEHAEAHRILFKKYGRWQDELAWKGLAGMIGKDEIIRIRQLKGSSNGGKISGLLPASDKCKEATRKANTGRPASDKQKEACRKTGKMSFPASDKSKEVARKTGKIKFTNNNPMKNPISRAKSALSRCKTPEKIAKWTKELSRLQALES